MNKEEKPNNGNFDDAEFDEVDFYIENQTTLTEQEQQEELDRIHACCDFIKKIGLTPNIPEPD